MHTEKCEICAKPVKVQIMKGTGVCGENCRKTRDNEENRPQAQTDAGITNLLNQPTGEVDPRGIV